MTVTDANAATNDASPHSINTDPHVTNATTVPDAAAATAENKMSVRQLLDGQEYPVAKGDIIKKGFDHEYVVEICVAYLHGLSQLPFCPRYTGYIIALCTYLKFLSIDNNSMLKA